MNTMLMESLVVNNNVIQSKKPVCVIFDKSGEPLTIVDDHARELPRCSAQITLLTHFRLLAEDIREIKRTQDAVIGDLQAYVVSTYTGLVNHLKTLYSASTGVYDWSVLEPVEKTGVVIWFDRNTQQLRCIVEGITLTF